MGEATGDGGAAGSTGGRPLPAAEPPDDADSLYAVLTETSAAITASGELGETLEYIARLVTERLGVAWCDLYDYVPDTDEYVVVAYYHARDVNVEAASWLGTRCDADNWAESHACSPRAPIIHYRDDPDLPVEVGADMDAWGAQSQISIPLCYRGDVFGMLHVGESREVRRWSDEDVRLLKAIADQAAVAVVNARNYARLAEQAVTDPLTGLSNFRHFMEQLRHEVAMSRRYGHAVSVLVIDLDGFREFVDANGRDAGDRALVELSEVLAECTRTDVDVIARSDGDQFMVVLPQTRSDDPEPLTASIVAERIRAAFAAHRLEGAGGVRARALTASIGVAGVGLGGYTAEEVLACADKAAYLAKHDGKDRVVVFGQ